MDESSERNVCMTQCTEISVVQLGFVQVVAADMRSLACTFIMVAVPSSVAHSVLK